MTKNSKSYLGIHNAYRITSNQTTKSTSMKPLYYLPKASISKLSRSAFTT